MRTASRVLVVLAIAVLVISVVVGGYMLGWWLKKDAVNRGAEINRNSFEFTEVQRDRIVDLDSDITTVELDIAIVTQTEGADSDIADALVAQRRALVTELCNVAADLNTEALTDPVRATVNFHCGGNR